MNADPRYANPANTLRTMNGRLAVIQKDKLRIGIAGLGAIGMTLAERLHAGIPGLSLAAATARDNEAAERPARRTGHCGALHAGRRACRDL
jgi:predicted homoserine dehydrogenase-like protein